MATQVRVNPAGAAPARARTLRPGQAVGTGVVAGLAGGLGFGILMQVRGMLPLVANLVGGSTSGLGWLVHLAISVFVGVTFAVLGVGFAIIFAGRATSLLSSTLLGLGYGALWWVLGGLLIMPVWLGMRAFTIDAMAWASLVGHLIYGLLLGAMYGMVAGRLTSRQRLEPADGSSAERAAGHHRRHRRPGAASGRGPISIVAGNSRPTAARWPAGR